MKILTEPNPILHKKTKEVENPKTPETKQLIKDMRKILKSYQGIGLSANQVSENKRLCIIELGNKFYVLINPEIVKKSKEAVVMEEGCLSVPGIYGLVERPQKITVKALDKNGKKIKIKVWGLLARVIQHEIDHLDGILFTEKTKQLYKIPTVEADKRRYLRG